MKPESDRAAREVSDHKQYGDNSLTTEPRINSGSDRRCAISQNQALEFQENGFIVIRKLFDESEALSMQRAIRSDKMINRHDDGKQSANNPNSQLVIWNKALDNIWGSIARSQRVVDTIEALLGYEVYHYHSKLSIKHAGSAAEWCWHQDYGYWYEYGCLFPDLGSVLIALNENTIENGCLKVIRGSHKLGRLDHKTHECYQSQVMPLDDPRQAKPAMKKPYGQSCADTDRVTSILKVLEVVNVELAPGDAVFFHCNVLHSSGKNVTEDSTRWSLICCYNGAHNSPDRSIARTKDHESYSQLKKVSDEQLSEIMSRLD